jgi:hypothetical protein
MVTLSLRTPTRIFGNSHGKYRGIGKLQTIPSAPWRSSDAAGHTEGGSGRIAERPEGAGGFLQEKME